ncbi:right-handed parallel beta-helix repeat-containing protein [Candidatus Binatia bacterium]|nr:right-handed parallel beta-helix repeat-containing protein [Candidatus Binatia bacterium]
MTTSRVLRSLLVLLLVADARFASAAVLTVAPSGGDFTSVQAALDAAVAGDTIRVHEGPTPYFEKIAFPRSGNAGAGFISLEAAPGEHPVLDGTGVSGSDMVRIEGRSWVRIQGFEIRNHLNVNDGSGVRITGTGSHVEVRDNEIHEIRGRHAMGITVYGTEVTPISDLVIDGNEIHHCDPATSEALAINGNVDGFAVTNNVVRDVNNIGIVMIGGETDIQPDSSKVARNGVCSGNRVARARSSYGGGFAGGIYVDGGRDIVVEHNVVTESDLGMEIGAENPGIVASGIVVRNNVLHHNDKAGLVFGGYASGVGRVRDSEFRNNTTYANDTLGAGFGELWIQYADANVVRNNVFVSTSANLLLQSDAGNTGNAIDHNVWWAPGGAAAARFVWNGNETVGFAAYRAATGQDASSVFADPQIVAPLAEDFHVGGASPAVNAGDPATVLAPGETDLDGAPRLSGPRVDAGVDEITCGDGVQNPGEECDDSNTVDGDGCDSNCTFTACGNGVVTAGEQCDDGNLAAGDCCAATCQYETNGSTCDDANPCTNLDACAAGVCSGVAAPATSCHATERSSLVLRDQALDGRDQLVWRWSRGDAVTLGDLGDPISGGTSYALCLYDTVGGTPSLAHPPIVIPSGGTCRGKACWKAVGTSGFKRSDRDRAPDGVESVLLRAGVAGKSSIVLVARGASLAPPVLPLAQDPTVTVQLRSSGGACFGAAYTAPARKSDATQFRDQTP